MYGKSSMLLRPMDSVWAKCGKTQIWVKEESGHCLIWQCRSSVSRIYKGTRWISKARWRWLTWRSRRVRHLMTVRYCLLRRSRAILRRLLSIQAVLRLRMRSARLRTTSKDFRIRQQSRWTTSLIRLARMRWIRMLCPRRRPLWARSLQIERRSASSKTKSRSKSNSSKWGRESQGARGSLREHCSISSLLSIGLKGRQGILNWPNRSSWATTRLKLRSGVTSR